MSESNATDERGRPTKFTRERTAKICERLALGWTRKAACEASGIGYTTLARWLAGDECIDPKELEDFREEIARAEAEAEGKCSTAIHDAAPTDWRAAESWLKRRRRDEWGDSIETTVKVDELRNMSDGELEALARRRGLA